MLFVKIKSKTKILCDEKDEKKKENKIELNKRKLYSGGKLFEFKFGDNNKTN